MDITDLPTVYEVPARFRRSPEIAGIATHGLRYFSLQALFPELPGLADRFDEDGSFRHDLRWATREDLFDKIARFSDKANEMIKALDGTLICALRAPDRSHEPRPCRELTELFRRFGWDALDGVTFLERLFSLSGNVSYIVQDRHNPSGSFSDIVSRGGGDHGWHQDSGWDKVTVLMGFPPQDRYTGEGVFSHVVRLSHPLRVPERPVPMVFNQACAGAQIPEECIWRPVYAKGREIIAYCDSATLHSAPDRIDREALWRLQ